MADLVDRYLELVTSYDGIGVGTDAERYYELIAANERPGLQRELGKLSGCALSIRGFWRLFGLDDPRITGPYRAGMAVTWLVAIAKERGAWTFADETCTPAIGSMVLIGGDKVRDGGVEHVYTTIDVSDDPRVIVSIDGGQVDAAGKQIIRKKQRSWVQRDGAVWDIVIHGTDPGSTARGGRRVQGWACIQTILDGL